ncbi:MAG: hypothetical protein AAFN27_02045 [Pseudomonadota bacterium]
MAKMTPSAVILLALSLCRISPSPINPCTAANQQDQRCRNDRKQTGPGTSPRPPDLSAREEVQDTNRQHEENDLRCVVQQNLANKSDWDHFDHHEENEQHEYVKGNRFEQFSGKSFTHPGEISATRSTSFRRGEP